MSHAASPAHLPSSPSKSLARSEARGQNTAPAAPESATPTPTLGQTLKAGLRTLSFEAQEQALAPTPAAPPSELDRFRVDLQLAERRFDTTWMSSLPSKVLEDVDREYSVSAASVVGARTRQALRAKAERELRQEPGFRKLPAGQQKRLIAQSLELLVAAEQAQSLERASLEIVAPKSMVGKDANKRERESLVQIPPGGVTRLEGRRVSRLNFMGCMVGVFGSEDAVKSHFKAIKPSQAPGSPWLAEAPRAALERASSTFERRHPGHRFAATGVAFQLRNRHHEVNSAGMLGHVLGIALDYQAYDNPHLKDASSRQLIELMGGGPSRLLFTDERGNELDYGRRRAVIATMGAETMASATSEVPLAQRSTATRRMLGQVDQSYTAMVATSQNLRASLGPEVEGLGGDPTAVLREAGERYWASRKAIKAAETRLVAADKRVEAARTRARARLERQRLAEAKKLRQPPVAVSAAELDADPAVAAERSRQLEAKLAYDALTAELLETVRQVLAPWRRRLEDRIANAAAAAGGVDARAVALPAVQEAYKAVQKAGKNDKRLRAALAHPKLAALLGRFSPGPELSGQALASAALGHLDALALVAIHRALLDRVETNLDFVLGASAMTVKDPAILQLLERGFIRDDAMDAPAAANTDADPERDTPKAAPAAPGARARDRQPVFNREFVQVMMEHGFEPAAAWVTADSMHFDHVASFSIFAGKKDKVYGAHGIRDAA